MNTENRINIRFGSLIRTTLIITCIFVVAFAVMPNFAQENPDTGDANNAAQISPEALRQALLEILSEQGGETDPQQDNAGDPSSAYDPSLIAAWEKNRGAGVTAPRR